MNDSIFHAQTLQTEVFRSARRLVEIEKYFVHWIPTGDDLVDLLIADCLPQNRKSPEQLAEREHPLFSIYLAWVRELDVVPGGVLSSSAVRKEAQ